MPKELHDKLMRRAKALGLKGKRRDAYVYGTLNKISPRSNKSGAKKKK